MNPVEKRRMLMGIRGNMIPVFKFVSDRVLQRQKCSDTDIRKFVSDRSLQG